MSPCPKYSFEALNRYYDRALDEATLKEMAGHIDHCPRCSALMDELCHISAAFTAQVREQIKEQAPVQVPRSVDNTAGGIFARFTRGIFQAPLGRMVSLAMVVFISIGVIGFKTLVPQSPSAIVNYIDTDLPSVMIIETEKQHHTIIWFSET